MDPISIGLGIVGLGLSVFGGAKSAEISHQQSQVSMEIGADEQRINQQKNMQMQLEAKRSKLEILRNVQRAQAQSINNATQQGAQFGSGLAGGLAQIQDQGASQTLGVNQNLAIGQNIFGLNNDISAKKIQLAQLGGDAATAQGLQSLGGAILKSGPIFGAFGKNLFGTSSGSASMSGYNGNQIGGLY
jgi:TolA-binding protein